ncbi:AAA family ATPase [Pseudomonas sp. CR3202]|uniref:AAA family ATPase n=1 Tax=Pseudomonas sp. CR3202 TaxID=3351532 RepID=UPI003BF0E0DB
MASGKTLRKLIQAGALGDMDAFRRASESVINEERQKQHHLLANDLEQILYGESAAFLRKPRSVSFDPPTDKERGLPLLSITQPQRSIEELILANTSLTALEELLEEHRREDVLRTYGMRASGKVLFYGPPGCGKTLAAEVLAFELDRPFVIIRLDALISSYLGETAANLRKIFDFISENETVALFDEFDAIGKERSIREEHGELHRVVNAVLQMMDAYQGKSLLLAATNHEQILDTAIWRRFDESIEFPLPGREELIKILKLKLRGIRRQFEVDDQDLLECFKGLSGADCERVVRRAIKQMILRNQEFLTIKDLRKALGRETHRSTIKEEKCRKSTSTSRLNVKS